MKKFEQKLEKWNFRKAVRIYVILLVIAALCCTGGTFYVYRGRISVSSKYSALRDAAEDGTTDLQTQIDALASSSTDIVDVLVLDNDNKVTYSAKDSDFSKRAFDVTRMSGSDDYLVYDSDSTIIFRYHHGEDDLFESDTDTDTGTDSGSAVKSQENYREKYHDDNLFESGSSGKTVYMLSYFEENGSTDKVCVISSPTDVAGGDLIFGIDLAVGIVFAALCLILLALWAYRDAMRSKMFAPLWGIVVLLTNVAGILVYQICKHSGVICQACGAAQSRLHLFCTNCGAKLGSTCPNCGAHTGRKDLFCHNCGSKIEK